MVRRLRTPAAVLVLATAAVLFVIGCSSEERLSPGAFCDEFVAIGPSAQGSADAIASGLEALAPRAPTPELGEAVSQVARVFVAYARVEREGGDAGMELARLGEDPEVVEDVATFGDFLTEECGLELDLAPPVDDPATGDVSETGDLPATEGAGATG